MALIGMSVLPLHAGETSTDPSRLDAELRQAVEAIRARQTQETRPTSGERLTLRGRILSPKGSVAILAKGDTYYTVREGDSLSLNQGQAWVKTITRHGVTLELPGKPELFLP